MTSLNKHKPYNMTMSIARAVRVTSLLLLLLATFTYYYSRLYHNIYENVSVMKEPFQWDIHGRSNYMSIQKARNQHLQDACADNKWITHSTYTRRQPSTHYYSKAYNFSYCKVPKIGSTFWTEVFLILNNRSVDTMLHMPRLAIHSHKTLAPSSRRQALNSRALLVTRDPYSRLYSGYIDKIYLSNKSILRKHIGTQNNMTNCDNFNVSFDQFLTFIVRKAKSNKLLDSHWAPIFSLCSPCDIRPYRIIKQETFSNDVDYVLKDINIEPSKYKSVTDILHDHRAEATIPGIVDTLYRKIEKQKDVQRCIGMVGVAKRLWTSFQIQGFIDVNIEFPVHAFKNKDDFANYTRLSDVILDTIKKYPIASKTSRSQRRKALVSAYKNVKKETIDDIKDVYGPDFELFDYNDNPPF